MATKKKARTRVRGGFMAIRSFRMHSSMLRKIDVYCDRVGVSRTELVRRLIAALPPRGAKTDVVRVRVV